MEPCFEKENSTKGLCQNLNNLYGNNNRTYRIRNSKKDSSIKNELKINFIKTNNYTTNPENLIKFNKFNLKNYYQQQNRNTFITTNNTNKLGKINENSESETDSIKKIPNMKNKTKNFFTNNLNNINNSNKKRINSNKIKGINKTLEDNKNNPYSEFVGEKDYEDNMSRSKASETEGNLGNKNNILSSDDALEFNPNHIFKNQQYDKEKVEICFPKKKEQSPIEHFKENSQINTSSDYNNNYYDKNKNKPDSAKEDRENNAPDIYKSKLNNHEFSVNSKKENLSNNSENREIIKLKNLNTNDTSSLRLSDSSHSKKSSFQLNYNYNSVSN